MRHLFIGGPGRSGTSFVADRLGTHPGVIALKDVELKIFCEKNGLLDLHHALVETYSPNRAVVAMDQFGRMAEALIEGGYGQPALGSVAPAAEWRAAFAAFADRLLADGHPVPQAAEDFMAAARTLLDRIAAVATRAGGKVAGEGALFLEKTPHNLLNPRFLARLAPGAGFLHVMRDPRAIAWSLLAMSWGPKTLGTATRWVDSYCRAWMAAEAEAAGHGLAILKLNIEDVVEAPEAAAGWLAEQLDLAPCPTLFGGASAEVLKRGAARAGPEDRALLQERLGGWAARFGYDRERIGCRLAPAFAAAVHEPAAGEPRASRPGAPEEAGAAAPGG